MFARACQLWCPSSTGQLARSQSPRLASTTSSSMTCLRLGMVRAFKDMFVVMEITFFQNMQTVRSWLRILGRTINTGRGSLQRRRGEIIKLLEMPWNPWILEWNHWNALMVIRLNSLKCIVCPTDCYDQGDNHRWCKWWFGTIAY